MASSAFRAVWRPAPPSRESGPRFEIELRVRREHSSGALRSRQELVFRTSHSRFSRAKVPVLIDLAPEVELRCGRRRIEKMLYLGLVGRGKTRTLEIVNRNPEVPYVLLNAWVEGEGAAGAVSISLETREWGQRYALSLSPSPGDRKVIQGTLKLMASHPRLAEIDLPLMRVAISR